MAVRRRPLIHHRGHFDGQLFRTSCKTSHLSLHFDRQVHGTQSETSHLSPWTLWWTSVWYSVKDLSPITVDTSTDRCMALCQRPLTYHHGHFHGQVYGTASETSHLSPWTFPRTNVWHRVRDLSPITVDTSTEKCMAPRQRPLTYHRGHFHGQVYGTQSKTSQISPWTLPRTGVWHSVKDLSPIIMDISTNKCMAPRQRPLTYHHGHFHGQVYGTLSQTSHLSPWTLPRTGV